VALAAIQALYRLVQEKEAQISGQQAQIADLESRVATLENASQVAYSPAHPFASGISPTWLLFGALCLAVVALLQPKL
jgi:hypothetical protein